MSAATFYFYLCVNATAMGCGAIVYEPMPLAQCLDLVKTVRVETLGARGQETRTVVVACVPGKVAKP